MSLWYWLHVRPVTPAPPCSHCGEPKAAHDWRNGFCPLLVGSRYSPSAAALSVAVHGEDRS